jgi:hypothetical protein
MNIKTNNSGKFRAWGYGEPNRVWVAEIKDEKEKCNPKPETVVSLRDAHGNKDETFLVNLKFETQ